MALTPEEQARAYRQVMNISAARSRQEQREKDMLHALIQRSELLLGIFAQVSHDPNPDPALADLVWRTNDDIIRTEVAREAGETVGTYAGETPEFPDDLPWFAAVGTWGARQKPWTPPIEETS